MIDVSSSQFYGEGYDDSDKRIPDMTIINKQLGMMCMVVCGYACFP
jgi:UDP-apiose/xylose synthase